MNDGLDEAIPALKFVPVCAIGASAGGVAALQSLFRQIPDDLGLAYVVILHLNPDEPSALSEILALCTKMPVYKVEDGPPLRPNCVYVIPPDRELVIDGDDVTARPFSEPRGQRALIDKFFRSVASGRGDGVAIILSGAGSDGSLGVAAIKEAGGIIMVQEPAEAPFPSMPQSAIATGMVDFVAPIARLAERLIEVARSKDAVRSLAMDGAANDLRRIVVLLRSRTGHDFSAYKRATVMRRVIRRMQVCRMLTLADYADHLLATPEEAHELLSDLLISVTMFFRDEAAFEALARHAVAPMVDRAIAEEKEGIRIWVVGCATGEEAYSVAMLVHEELARRKATLPFQIFATDLDEAALATAREGRYPRTIAADVSADRLARFFIDEGPRFRVRKELRENVIFAKHSILREPPFMRLHLITCRNLLIYLERAVQAQVCSIFNYGLLPGRFLFLGSAETVDTAAELFTPVDRQARIYSSNSQSLGLPTLPQFSYAEPIANPASLFSAGAERAGASAMLHAEALEHQAPPSVLVDEAHNILHLSPTAGRFVLLSAGPMSKSLPAVVRPELRLDLKLALTRAIELGKKSITLPTVVAFEGERRRVAMRVAPVASPAQKGPQALVYFLDGDEVPLEDKGDPLPDVNAGDVRRLYAELKGSQEALLSSRSGHDSSIQELRAANEELQSMNEESRATAEELETSKEELQSINEELHTVNAELKSKFETISVAHSDLQNLTAATEIGTLFLDAEMRIRMFTPPVTRLFNITQLDIGRPLGNFTHQLAYNALADDVRRVLQDLAPVERVVDTLQGGRYVLRLRPYRTVEDRIDGTVVTFVDVSERARAEAELRHSEVRLRDVLDAVAEGFTYFAPDFTILDVNAETLRLDGRTREDLVGRSHWEAFPGSEISPLGDFYRGIMADRVPGKFEHSYSWPDGRTRWLEVRAYPTADSGMAIFWTDVSDRKQRELNAAFLDDMTKALALESLPDEIMAMAAARIGEFLQVSACVLIEVLEEADEVVVQYAWNAEGTPTVPRQRYNLDDFIPGGLRASADADAVFAVSDTQSDPRTNAESYAKLQMGAFVVVHFHWGGRWTSYLGVTDTKPRSWREDEIALLRELTNRIYLRYERARADAALREREASLAAELANSETLQLFSTRLIPEQDPDALYEHLMDAAMVLMKADAASVQIVDADGRRLRLLASRNFHPESSAFWQWVDADSASSCGKALSTGDRTLIEDIESWEEMAGTGDLAAYRRSGLRAVQSTPLVGRDGQRLGMISTHWRRPWQPAARDFTVFDVLARQAADLLDRAHTEAALRDSESRYRSALRVGRIGSWETNYATGIRHWSAEGLALFGIDLPNGLGRVGGPDDEWRAALHPDEHGFPATLTQDIARLDQREVEYRILRPNGEVVWLHGHIRVIERDAQGGVTRSMNVAADITERREAEVALRESEERFRSMAEAIEDVFYLIDLDRNTLVYLSPRYEAVWGWPAEAIQDDLGVFLDTIHPDDRPIAVEAKAAQERGEPVMFEYRVVRADGDTRLILDRSFPISGAAGRRLAGVATDITERRRAEEAARSSDHRFRLLVESVRDYAIFTVNLHGIVTSWPAGAAAVFGWSEAEMLGRPAAVTFTPEDVAAGVPETEMATAIQKGLAPNVRWHQRSDGSRVFINGSMQPLIGPDGVVRELIKIGQDETQTRRVQQALTTSEKQLRTLTEGIPQLVWRSAEDGQWTWSSRQWQSFTGQSLAQSLGLGWMEAVHPDDHEAAHSAWKLARSNGSLDVEYRVRRASDGAWLWHHTRSLPVRDDEEAILEWLGTTTDVQQLKELQERQAVMVAELQHRTRNLITVVGAVARQTMEQTGPTKAFVDEFEHRLAALARVQGLLSRSEDEPVTIGKLIRMELDALGVRGNAGLRVEIDGPPVPLRNSIVQTLALAIHELATNALKHGALSQSQGRLSVIWKLLRSEAAERSLAIEWTETGTAGEVEALPSRRGYGRELIERALPYALGAKTSYAFTPDGLRCTIDIPLDRKRRGTGG